MKLTLGGLLDGAGELWKAEHDLLLRVAGVFFLLPQFAEQLFLKLPDLSGADLDQMNAVLANWLLTHWPWVIAPLVQVFGSGLLLVLLLDPARPKVSEAMARVLTLMPVLILLWFASTLAIGWGVMLLLVPGIYLMGRLCLLVAVVVADPQPNPGLAVAHAIERTRGNGWLLALASILVTLAMFFVAVLISPIAVPIAKAAPLLSPLVDLLVSAVGAAGALGQVLVQAAAYRALSAKQGI